MRELLGSYLVLVSVGGGLVDGESPPVVVAGVEILVLFECVPALEDGELLQALFPDGPPLLSFPLSPHDFISIYDYEQSPDQALPTNYISGIRR